MSAVDRALCAYRRCRMKHGSNANDAVTVAVAVLEADPVVSDADLGLAVRALLAEKRVDAATDAALFRFDTIAFEEEQRELRRRHAA